MYNDILPFEKFNIKKLPPKVINEILIEELDYYKIDNSSVNHDFFEQKVFQFQEVLSKYQIMKVHDLEVRKRYLSIFMQSKNKYDE